jgi:phospholipid/cholesterol/gamma-HCH transport system substrate-binding protein
MRLTRTIKIQLTLFTVVATVAGCIMLFGYIKAPANWFGIGRYTVTVQLPEAAGLYVSGNVTYRGTEVGRVRSVRLTDHGVEAELSLRTDIAIPSNVDAQVHSASAVGEQYIALRPRDAVSKPLANGDVIPLNRTSVPPDINSLLDATNRDLLAIPKDSLKTVVDESATAVGGLGPELSRIVRSSTRIARDARESLGPLSALIDQAQPVLDSQVNSAQSIDAWASNLAIVSQQVAGQDAAVGNLIDTGGPAAEEARQLFSRLQPSVPLLMANLVSVNEVAIRYQPALEQVLVLVPQGTAALGGALVPNLNTKQAYKGIYLDFNLAPGLPPVCNTGFLPAQQIRNPVVDDFPERPAGSLYCRTPQDSYLGVRGARNYPCLTRPGKRAATVAMCESDEPYVPLNDGNYWKGDPNATFSGQSVPQLDPGVTPPQGQPAPTPGAPPAGPPPLAVATYDPATGTYLGPDGKPYTQTDLARNPGPKTWQGMLAPPGLG